jgi:glucokinase
MTQHTPSIHHCVIGLDVGGTKIAGGLVQFPSGTLTHKRTLPTLPQRGGEPVLQDVLAMAQQLMADAANASVQVAGIGLGICELVDRHGNVTSDFTVKWKGVPVQARLSEIAPAVVESDVRAHAKAESMFGQGRRFRDFVFLSVGTGISSCLVQNGVPYAGARGNALVCATSPLTLFLEDGSKVSQVMEAFSSGSGIAQRFGVERAETVFDAAAKGDARALQVLESAGAALGNTAAFLANVLDPEAIIVGGGLGSAGGPYWQHFVEVTREHIWSDDTRNLPIIKAALANDAGVIGAAASCNW